MLRYMRERREKQKGVNGGVNTDVNNLNIIVMPDSPTKTDVKIAFNGDVNREGKKQSVQTISEQYQRILRKPKAQKQLFNDDQIIR